MASFDPDVELDEESNKSETSDSVVLDDLTDPVFLNESGPTAAKIPRRGPTASHPIWDYFTQDRDDRKSVCNICKVKLNTLKSTNVENHLRRHAAEFKEYTKKKESIVKQRATSSKTRGGSTSGLKSQTLEEAFARRDKTPYPKGSARNEELTDSLALFIATNSVSLRAVENPHFRDFVSTLDSRYRLPDRHVLSDRIKSLAAKIRISVQKKINEAGRIAVCADIWSRPGLTQSFLGISAHFYSKITHQRHSALLALAHFPSPHSGERIKSVIDNVLLDWAIPENTVLRFVTDNGSNMVKAIRNAVFMYNVAMDGDSDSDDFTADPNLEEEETPEENAVSGTLDKLFQKKHMRCFVHSLMRVLARTVDKNQDFKSFRESIFRFVNKVSKSGRLQERLIALGGLKIIVPSATRWNSTYFVFERLLRLRGPLDQLLDEERLDPLPWRTLEMYIDFLKPFATNSDKLQGTHYPTISSVLPTLIDLGEHLENQKNDARLSELITAVQTEIQARFAYIYDSAVSSFDPTYAAACMLDPTVALSLDDGQLNAAKTLIISMSNDDQSNVISNEPVPPAEPSRLSSAVLERIEKRRLSAATGAFNTVQTEITAYWNALATGSPVQNSIEFWSQEKAHYRKLYEIAMDILGVPATSAPLESYFSQASAVLDGRRYRLSEKSLEAELFLRINACFR